MKINEKRETETYLPVFILAVACELVANPKVDTTVLAPENVANIVVSKINTF